MRASDLDDWTTGTALDLVGSSVDRVDAVDKVTGRARYTADVQLPGQLTGVIVRSPIPHGRVVSIDTASALGVEGVVDVLTADDIDEISWYEDDAPLLPGIVRYVGDEVALVVAETRSDAERGVGALSVEYEPMEFLTHPDDVERPGAPELLGNESADEVEEDGRGDVDEAFDDAHIVVEGTFRTPVAIHNSLEPHGAVADWVGDSITLYTSTQGVNDVREQMGERLGLNHNQVRVVSEFVGGGFGAKQVAWKPTMLAALASKRTGRPVWVMNDRSGENVAAGKRNGTEHTVRIAADPDGRLLAIDADVRADRGAYAVKGEASAVSGPYLHLYQCARVRTRVRRVRTNTGPAVAFRAPGYVESTFVLESLMDELAGELDIDPIELRRRNHSSRNQQEDLEWSQPEGLLRSYERVAEVARWDETDDRDETDGEDEHDGLLHGRGFAAHDWLAASAMPPGHAGVEFNFDGSVHVSTSAQDIGTGTRTVLAQVVADELGVDISSVRLSLGDTSTGPPAPTSAGSTTVPTMAPAVRAAAAAAVDDLLDAAAEHHGVERSSLSFDGTHVKSSAAAFEDQPLGDLLSDLSPRVVHGWGGRETIAEDVSPRAQGSAVAEVSVDPLTGEVRVTSITVAPDCGRILNRRLADSQVIGGVTQGIGFALTEEQVVDHRLGVVVNPDLNEYLLPTVSDTCTIRHAALDIPDLRANPLGTKGIGELPLIAVPAAIANAVRDATGIRLHELPITRRRLLEAIASSEALDHESGDHR
ncbi:xanthine dehydrogenase family protein molybdopterin-binding subunit [Ilumatobacter nonamiensis]|uniref:xanthine dehydrogenase family protein molybdopterin-binding subunit n=1 Tax=Ilumatobacter nonamiensis TaxID=467093 RepID=UPI000346CB46|nr:xanthine dehydrogenase family protein molybdopterin-binding subunit [Ilumatobacter nonamiensis]